MSKLEAIFKMLAIMLMEAISIFTLDFLLRIHGASIPTDLQSEYTDAGTIIVIGLSVIYVLIDCSVLWSSHRQNKQQKKVQNE